MFTKCLALEVSVRTWTGMHVMIGDLAITRICSLSAFIDMLTLKLTCLGGIRICVYLNQDS